MGFTQCHQHHKGHGDLGRIFPNAQARVAFFREPQIEKWSQIVASYFSRWLAIQFMMIFLSHVSFLTILVCQRVCWWFDYLNRPNSFQPEINGQWFLISPAQIPQKWMDIQFPVRPRSIRPVHESMHDTFLHHIAHQIIPNLSIFACSPWKLTCRLWQFKHGWKSPERYLEVCLILS